MDTWHSSTHQATHLHHTTYLLADDGAKEEGKGRARDQEGDEQAAEGALVQAAVRLAIPSQSVPSVDTRTHGQTQAQPFLVEAAAAAVVVVVCSSSVQQNIVQQCAAPDPAPPDRSRVLLAASDCTRAPALV